MFCFRFCPHGPPGWLCFFFFFFEGGVASDADPGWTASSFLFSPSHCQLQLSHRGTIEKRRGCSLNGKNKLESPPTTPSLPLPITQLPRLPPTSLPQDSSSAFDRTPVLLSSPPLFFFFLLFSPRALHNPPFSLSLPAKCSCCSPLDHFFFSGWLLIRIAFFFFFFGGVLSLKLVKLAIFLHFFSFFFSLSPLYSSNILEGSREKTLANYTQFTLGRAFFQTCTQCPMQHSYSLQLLYCAVASYYSAHFSFECQKSLLWRIDCPISLILLT